MRHSHGFHAKKDEHEHYSTATCMCAGYAFKDVAMVIWNQLIKDGMDEKEKLFLFLKNGEWREKITASALCQPQAKSWKKPKVLLLNKDIQDFNAYVQEQSFA